MSRDTSSSARSSNSPRGSVSRDPPDAHGEANLNLGTSQSVAAPAELSAPVHERAHPGYAGDRSLMPMSERVLPPR